MHRTRADAERALATMSGTMLGSRRIRCGWAQHKQENTQASYAAVDRVRSCMLLVWAPSCSCSHWSVLWALWVLPGWKQHAAERRTPQCTDDWKLTAAQRA